MSQDHDSDSEAAEPEDSPRVNVVFVDGIKHEIEEDTVQARRLIEVAQDDSENFDLVALRGRGGGEVRVFDHTEEVDLTEEHRTHFDTKGDGKNFV